MKTKTAYGCRSAYPVESRLTTPVPRRPVGPGYCPGMANVDSLLVLLGTIGPLLGGIAALVNMLLGADTRQWRAVKLQAEILAILPQNAAATVSLERLVNERIEQLVAGARDARRQVDIAIMAAITVVLCVWGTWFSVEQGGRWLLLLVVTIPLGAACGYGVTESLAKVPRDDSGNRIEDSPI